MTSKTHINYSKTYQKSQEINLGYGNNYHNFLKGKERSPQELELSLEILCEFRQLSAITDLIGVKPELIPKILRRRLQQQLLTSGKQEVAA